VSPQPPRVGKLLKKGCFLYVYHPALVRRTNPAQVAFYACLVYNVVVLNLKEYTQMFDLRGLEGSILSLLLVVAFMAGMYHVAVEVVEAFTAISNTYHSALQNVSQ